MVDFSESTNNSSTHSQPTRHRLALSRMPLSQCNWRKQSRTNTPDRFGHCHSNKTVEPKKTKASMPRLKLRRCNIYSSGITTGSAVPDTSTKSGDVNHLRIFYIRHHPMSPLEVVSRDPSPVLSLVARSPCRRLKARRIQDRGIMGIDRHIIDMLIAVQRILPALAAVDRHEDSSARAVLTRCAGPGGEIEPVRVTGIDGHSIRSIHLCRKFDRS